MKNYISFAISASMIILLNGCTAIKDASTSIGSTGTGVIAGLAAGAGTGLACDKLTGGKNTGACVAAGMAVGAIVGKIASDFDESVEKSVPAMDCKTVKKRMNYPSTAVRPKAHLKIEQLPSKALKQNEPLKLLVKMDLATPGNNGKEQPIAFKVDLTSGDEKNTGRVITKDCGGDYILPLSVSTDKEGVFNTSLKLLDANTGIEIEGGAINFCYTVAKDGVNKCGVKLTSLNTKNLFSNKIKEEKIGVKLEG